MFCCTVQSYGKVFRIEIDYHEEKMDNITMTEKYLLSLQKLMLLYLHAKNQKRFFR